MKLGKLEVRPNKKKSPHLILVRKLGKFSQIRKVHLEDQENWESSLGTLGTLGKFIRKIRKVHSEDQESQESSLGKFPLNIRKILVRIRKIPPKYQKNSASKNRFPESKTLFPTMPNPPYSLSSRYSPVEVDYPPPDPHPHPASHFLFNFTKPFPAQLGRSFIRASQRAFV